MFVCEAGADLEQGLVVSFEEFVHDRSTGGICESPEQVTHAAMIGKYTLAYQETEPTGSRDTLT
jgi:hypothetical protein